MGLRSSGFWKVEGGDSLGELMVLGPLTSLELGPARSCIPDRLYKDMPIVSIVFPFWVTEYIIRTQ